MATAATMRMTQATRSRDMLFHSAPDLADMRDHNFFCLGCQAFKVNHQERFEASHFQTNEKSCSQASEFTS